MAVTSDNRVHFCSSGDELCHRRSRSNAIRAATFLSFLWLLQIHVVTHQEEQAGIFKLEQVWSFLDYFINITCAF